MKKLSLDELNRVNVEEFKVAEKVSLVVVLDNVRSLNNIGSIFRTADAFCLQEIHLCGITATPPHREIHKTALGAENSVDWQYFSTTQESIEWLKTKGFSVWAVEQTTQSIMLDKFDISSPQPLAIVLGNEVDGVDENLLPLVDGCIEIPQFGTKHSLNVSIAGGIVIWELFKKMKRT